MGDYRATYTRSITEPEAFWADAATAVLVAHARRPGCSTTRSPPFYRWFPDGELNTCENALDRHVAAGHGDRTALIYDSPVTGTQAHLHLRRAARRGGDASPVRCASLGVGKGDRVVIYLPMVPEAVVAMLACARLGAVHSVVFGGFAASELAARIDDARPRSSCPRPAASRSPG